MININYIENVGFIGEYNKDLSLELIKKLASSIYLLENNNIVLGYEPRLSSKKITSVIINSLRETNLNVYILGIVELPGLIYYSKINNAVGIMLTANNNLYSYNGIAIYNDLPMNIYQFLHDKIVFDLFPFPKQFLHVDRKSVV